MLTVDQLKAMPELTNFATGTAKNEPGGLHMTSAHPGRELRWVAQRGRIHDWTIYVFWSNWPTNYITDWGDKIHDKETIKKLVPCTDEALQLYRK